MAIKYYVCGSTIPELNSPKIKKMCEAIENFMSASDDDTVKKIKEYSAPTLSIWTVSPATN